MHVQAVKDALALYTSTRAYRQALAHGGFRVTVDGTVSEPVTARVQDAAIAALRDDGTRLPPGAVRRMRQARRASTIARRGRREGTLTLGSLFET